MAVADVADTELKDTDVSDTHEADKLLAIEQRLDEFLSSYEPGRYTVQDATVIMRTLTKMKRRLAAAELSTARRLQKAHVHEHQGFKNAGHWLSNLTGQPPGQAAASLDIAKALEDHPLVQEAFNEGKVSEQEAKEIASAADACPDEARSLLETAARGDFGALKKRCQEVRNFAGSEADEIARYEKIRKSRFCRTWVDSEGAGHLEARVTPDALAIIRSTLGEFEKQVFEDARRQGRRESRQAYMADALVAMALGSYRSGASPGDESGDPGSDSASGPASDPVATSPTARDASRIATALVRVRIDCNAFLRGHTEPGETCSIPGVGPVPVALVRGLITNAILELVVTRGTDVTTVCTDSRYIRKALRIALEERDQVCVVPGCNASDPLEIDHWQVDFADDGPTSLDNLARLCPWHHDQKTYRGWRLEGPPGQWRFTEPPGNGVQADDPRSRAGGDACSSETGAATKRRKTGADEPPLQQPLL